MQLAQAHDTAVTSPDGPQADGQRQHGPARHTLVAAAKVRIPATSPAVLVRERLHVLLDAAIEGVDPGPPVTVVCAPAGYGKTTMLATWARHRTDRSGARVAWVSVDVEDNDVVLLWTAVVRALEVAGAWPAGAGPTPPPDDQYGPFVARLITSVEQLAQPVVLVLDGVHDLRSDGAVRTVNLLLRHSPATMPVVLATRFPPPLILPRLRLEGRLRELGQDSLTFTPVEARSLYVRDGVQLTDGELALLMERTEGWAAALRLAALTLDADRPRGELIRRLTGDDQVVADYLVGEVVTRQPEEVQRFMLTTCVCRTFSARLAAELSQQENAGQILDWLERTGVLVATRDRTGRSYRYHPLLRGYLRAELGRRDLSALRRLHHTATGWYVAAGEQLPAIEHAAAAGDNDLLTRMLAKFGLARVLAGDAHRLRRILDAVPPHVLGRPSVALVAAATALDLGDVPAADRFLRSVDSAAHPLRTQRLRALRATIEVHRGRLHGDTGEALAALKSTRAGKTGDLDVDLFTHVNRGIAVAWTGRHQAAEVDLEEALHLAVAEGRDATRLQCETHLAAICAVRGDLAGMGTRAKAALAIAEDRGWAQTSRCAYLYALLGSEAYERAEDERARELARLATGLLDGPIDPSIELFVLTVGALVGFDTADDPHQVVATLREQWQRLGGRSIAPALLAYAAPAHQRMALLVGEYPWAADVLQQVEDRLGESGEQALLRAVLHTHRGKVGSTRRLLEPVLEHRVHVVSPATSVHSWLLEAHLAARCGEQHRAHEALTEALTLAAPHQALRPFRDAGQSIRSLLASGAGRFGRLDPFAAGALAEIPVTVPDPTDGLTEREQALLTELPSMRTAEEIAHTMFVSVNTIKTHLRGIYRKLGVNHRRDAITVARRRGLL
ncbi:LuxR C-terminal-related transcriptional regulator [Amycolatopsis magusensis]|uniref:LuxR C-terminal-related transcriptional regulator n=1 Tax=Amycolatopsis magusensis TaxID=882444 RepID=UPI0024A88867|nr:LuxR C-terminal-related transcriptional regulator [Amycolatopsis magusensis]MDI5978153.1 LuxR C-terminal-related transcriptional regulator [Amycolatopsis magusensis]